MIPAFTPFTFHWYIGDDPAFAAVAVYITGVPRQEGFAEDTMETLTVRFGLTVMLIWFEEAGLPVAQK